MTLDQRSIRGKILYIHNQDGEIGREWFTFTVQPNGDRTLRAQCEMDDSVLLRDVIYAVDGGWRPQDAFIRLTIHGKLVGSSWFYFNEEGAQCEGYTTSDGRISQKLDLGGYPTTFGAHPVTVDAMTSAAFDHGRGETKQFIPRAVTSSSAADGGTGPMLMPFEKSVEYVGKETVKVPAGTFETDRYLIHLEHYDHPLDVRVIPKDHVLVRLTWGHWDVRYDLVELET